MVLDRVDRSCIVPRRRMYHLSFAIFVLACLCAGEVVLVKAVKAYGMLGPEVPFCVECRISMDIEVTVKKGTRCTLCGRRIER